MMKHTILMLVVVLLSVPRYSFAQSGKGDVEMEIAAGTLTLADMVKGMGKHRGMEDLEVHYGAVYMFSCRYYLLPSTALGISVSWHNYTESYFSNADRVRKENNTAPVTIAAELKQVYDPWNLPSLQFYSTFGAGLQYDNYPGNKPNLQPAFYCSLIGFRLGIANALTLQLGVGYKGLFSGGYSFRLSHARKKAHGPVPVDREVNLIY